MRIMATSSSKQLLHTTLQYMLKTPRCYCSVTPLPIKHRNILERVEKKKQNSIIDKRYIYVRGGRGGSGRSSVGGIGGDGGSVYVKCVEGASLAYYSQFNRKFWAQPGQDHKRNLLKINDGDDLFLSVPPGTEVTSGNQNPGMENGQLICDMNVVGDTFKLVEGGKGACPRNNFKPSKGESKSVYLELKMIADAAFTGFPNAGKSSLLRAISRATPRVGNYPFTTIRPMVGSVLFSDNSQVKVADLPGLIEGAHLNKGMGHKFLRHIERTKVVVLVVDINGFQLNADTPHRTPFEMILYLLKELALYQEVILNRPMILLFNKMDTPGSEQRYQRTIEDLNMLDASDDLLGDFDFKDLIVDRVKQFCDKDLGNVFKVSAETNIGLADFKMNLHQLLVAPVEEE